VNKEIHFRWPANGRDNDAAMTTQVAVTEAARVLLQSNFSDHLSNAQEKKGGSRNRKEDM
jgi:hypothetical protein